MTDLPPLSPREIQKFFGHVKVSKTESWGEPEAGIPVTPCWEWTGCTCDDGYGKFRFAGKTWRAHRWIWIRMMGRYCERDEDIHHHCCNAGCVNPAHLENKHKSHRWKETNGVPF
jgi:hypothetical protein